MTWIIYALLTALFNAAKSVSSKKSLRSLDEYVVSWFICFLPGVLILPYYFFTPIPPLGNDFWSVLIADCLLSAIAAVWSTKALLKSDLSITTPLAAFTPLFMLLTGYLMLGELPTTAGAVGVILVVIGAYFLNIKERKNGRIAPFKALLRDEGAQLMLGAAFIWSVTGIMDKIVIRNSEPIFFAMAENFLIAFFILPFAWKRLRRAKKEIRKERLHLIGVGTFSALALVCQMIAINETLVVYVVAIKRFSILLSIILGGIIFKEKEIRQKFVGGAIMVLGVLFLTIL
jgi:drug/metabolite transporter (DMT)-like permease